MSMSIFQLLMFLFVWNLFVNPLCKTTRLYQGRHLLRGRLHLVPNTIYKNAAYNIIIKNV